MCQDAFYASKKVDFEVRRYQSCASFKKEANEPKSEVDNDIIEVKADLFQKMWNWRQRNELRIFMRHYFLVICFSDAKNPFWQRGLLFSGNLCAETEQNPKWTSAAAIVICKVPITNSRTTWTVPLLSPFLY